MRVKPRSMKGMLRTVLQPALLVIFAALIGLTALAQSVINTWDGGYRINTGQTGVQVTIGSVSGTCQTVSNMSGRNYFIPTKTNAEWNAFTSHTPANVSIGACTCNLPWGGTLANGASVTAYSAASVACGSLCSSVAQTRTCTSGTLSGSYTNSSCSVAACASCNLPWGGSIVHGASVTAYNAASVPCGSSCAPETRTCTNGTLSGSYTNSSCSAASCACNLPWGGSIANGASVTAYNAASVPCGSSCASQTRTCTNTVLSGTYTNSSCSVAACASCNLPWGGSIANGASVTAYSAASVPCGSSCASQTRTCTNGTLSGSYTNSGCSIGSCACNLPWGGSIANGASVTAYANSSVPCGSSCASQTRICTNTVLSGTYTNQSCSVGVCASCPLPWGGSIAHGASVTAYSAASVPCGSLCSSVAQTRTCTNGFLSGTNTNQSCSVAACIECRSNVIIPAPPGYDHNSVWIYAGGGSCFIIGTSFYWGGIQIGSVPYVTYGPIQFGSYVYTVGSLYIDIQYDPSFMCNPPSGIYQICRTPI